MGQKSSSGGTQTTKVEPPAYQLPYLQNALPAAQDLYNQGGPQQYSGNTVVPFAPQSEQALSGIAQRATNGSPVVDTAQSFVQKGLLSAPSSSFGIQANPYASGSNPYGGASNPYLDATFQHAADKTRGILEGEYARAGRNIGASAPVRADMLTDLATKIYAPAYESERNRQFQYGSQQLGIGANSFESGQDRRLQDLASQRSNQMGLLGYAQPLANQDYMDLDRLRGVGGELEAQTGKIIDDRVNRWNFEQNRPQQNYDTYLGRISGNQGQTSTTQLPRQYSNQTAGLLGGALGGAQIGSMFGPWGTGIGALGGAVLGGLF